jgi:hypothetical protein
VEILFAFEKAVDSAWDDKSNKKIATNSGTRHDLENQSPCF